MPILLRFLSCMSLLILAYSLWQSWFATAYLQPVSLVAATLLDLIGIETAFDASSLTQGFCALVMEQQLFHVTFRCSGLFSLFIYWGAVVAYPTSAADWTRGILAGGLAFFIYSSGRIVMLGVISYWMPTWLPFCHIYLMVLLNLGFVFFLWASWINHCPLASRKVPA